MKGGNIGPNCSCSKMCFIKWSDEEKKGLLNRFNEFSNQNQQYIYLQLIEKWDVKVRRPRKNDPKIRISNVQNFVLKGCIKINVCKKSVISVHGITEGRVRCLCSLLLEGRSPKDRRGIHTKVTHYGGKQLL